jgi:hypothetical protein
LIELKGKNALGQVKGGILTIQATVLGLEVQRTPNDSDIESGDMETTHVLHNDIPCSFHADEHIPSAVDKVFFVYICETMGLALLPMQSARSTFRRIGLCSNMNAIDKTAPKSTICII